MSEREEIPFVNELGQEINPGDKCLIVIHSTGDTYTYEGTYIGQKNGKVQAFVGASKFVRVFKGTDDEVDIYQELRKEGLSYGSVSYQERWKQLQQATEFKKIPYVRVSTLQRNRIYKLAA